MNNANQTVLSEEEIQELAGLLKKLQPGYLPFEIFAQLARIMALPIVEIMPLRQKDGRTEILLTQRVRDDEYWPELWHAPGTVVRGSDVSIKQAFKRVLVEELNGLQTSQPALIMSAIRESERGREVAQIFWVEVRGESTVGKFFDVQQLPENIIASQVKFIHHAAAKAYPS